MLLILLLKYLVIVDAMEQEDEQSLQTVEDREHVGEEERLLIDVDKAYCPCQSKENNQHQGTLDPRPEEGE